MEREQNDTETVAEIWRNAQQRRAEDIGIWFGQFIERRRRQKASDADAPYPQGNPALR
jgi:hypothetical protein